MEKPIQFLLLLFTTVMICSPLEAADSFEIMTENYPPFNYVKNEKVGGAVTQVVKEIQQRIGDQTPIQLYSWNKAYEIIKTKPNKVLFSMAKTAVRTPSFQWVGPIMLIEGFFFQHKDAKRAPKNLDDIKNNYIVGVRENSNIHLNFIKEGYKHLVPLESTEAYYRGLYYRRVDLIVASSYNIPFRAKQYDLDPGQFQKTKISTNTGKLYIAFSYDTSDTIIQQWQNTLKQIQAEGLLEKLIQKGLQETEKDFGVQFTFDEI